MPTEPQTLAAIAAADTLASEHPNWVAFVAWAREQQALYEASRQRWRAQNPAVDVAALEDAYGVSPVVLTIEQLKGAARTTS
jgi:hypothetical protein